MSGERSSVGQGAEVPEGTHLAAMVTGADMELDGMHLAATEEAKQMLKQHSESLKDLVAQSSRIGWARLSELEEKADEFYMELKSQREALDTMDDMMWDGLQGAKDESDSLRARLLQGQSQVTQLPERIKGEIRAGAPDATSAADTRTPGVVYHRGRQSDGPREAAGREGSHLLKAAGRGRKAAEGKGGRLRLPPCRRVPTPSADRAVRGKARY